MIWENVTNFYCLIDTNLSIIENNDRMLVMKKIFLVVVCIFSFVLVQNLVLAQEIVPCVSDETTQRTQFEPKTELSENVKPATLISAPVPASKCTKKIADNVDFDTYMRYLQRKVQLKWYPPICDDNKKTVIAFSIAKNGMLFNSKILNSSGDETFDKAAMEAVDGAVPLMTLPTEVKPNFVEMQFTFDSNPLSNNCHCFSYYGTESNHFKNVSNGSSSAAAYTYYQEQIDKIISLNVPQKQYYFVKNSSVSLGLDKSGKVQYANLVKSSGSEHYDESVISSLKACEFPPIPNSLNIDSIDFNYTLASPPYSTKNKNVLQIGASYVARVITIIVTGH